MAHQIRKLWVKKSPCSGCWCLDRDADVIQTDGEEAKVEFDYCEIVTDFDRFVESRYGVKIGKQRLYRNCPHKNYG